MPPEISKKVPILIVIQSLLWQIKTYFLAPPVSKPMLTGYLALGICCQMLLVAAQPTPPQPNEVAPVYSSSSDTVQNTNQPYRYSTVLDSSVMDSALQADEFTLQMPYPLYRSLFNQARIRYSTANSKSLYPADSILLESVLQDTLLQAIAHKTEFDIQIKRPKTVSELPVFLLFFATLLLFAYTKNRFSYYFIPAWQAFTKLNLSRQFFEDSGFSHSPASKLLTINSSIITGSLLYFSLIHLNIALPALPAIGILLACIGIMALLFFSKRICLLLLANIALPLQEVIYFYLFNRDIIINTSFIILIPFVIVSAFAQTQLALWSWLLALTIALLAFIYSYLRGLVIAKDIIWFHKFHFLLYLCTFEIAPWLIIAKLLHE